jgi:hypothetical protein
MANDHAEWANWTAVRLMTHDQQIRYAIFSAELVIKIYEDKYPNNDRPRKAIEAAKTYLKDKTEGNKNAAAHAADAADAAYAADAADAAYAAYAAAHAAYAAAHAAHAADAAAHAAAHAAHAAHAAYAADAAAHAADAAALKTIIEHGLSLLGENKQ